MKPHEYKLLDVLSNNDVTFYIPPYQRNYEWDKEQCSVFLEDIIKTVENNKSGVSSEHFFGSVTYFQETTAFGQPNRLILIDGQQRITTTMLFLVAVRDVCVDNGVKNVIESRYLRNNNVQSENDEYKIKLKQVETDWTAYKNLILKYDLTDSEKMSAVYINYLYFSDEIKKIISDHNHSFGDLIELGLSKFSVITIELEPDKNRWENPQEIFESMNSLGKPLSLADLIRNYLLLGLDQAKQEALYNHYWIEMERKLGKQISNFIRDYMQVIAEKPIPKATDRNHKKLYKDFKDMFYGVESEKLLGELNRYATFYSYIEIGASTGNNAIDKKLADLRLINVTTSYSYLLALFNSRENGNITDGEMTAILDILIIYFLRRKMILGLTSAENKGFPLLVRTVPALEQAENKTEKLYSILSSQENMLRLPNDVELRRVLETLNFYSHRLCKFILALIEEKLTRSRPDLSDTKLQIEHIMPQKLNATWELNLGENARDTHQELVHTIGNLTLIRHNQELGQKSFEEKKTIYDGNAGLQIARTEITNNTIWGETEIKKRTKWLTDFILRIVLPIPDSMRKTNNFLSSGNRLDFNELQLIGSEITFIADKSIAAIVVSSNEVEFEGKKWRLSPLTRELYERIGRGNSSGSYRGAAHWEFDGIKLEDIL